MCQELLCKRQCGFWPQFQGLSENTQLLITEFAFHVRDSPKGTLMDRSWFLKCVFYNDTGFLHDASLLRVMDTDNVHSVERQHWFLRLKLALDDAWLLRLKLSS